MHARVVGWMFALVFAGAAATFAFARTASQEQGPGASAAGDAATLVAALDAASGAQRDAALVELLSGTRELRAAAVAAPLPTTVAGRRAFARLASKSGDALFVPRALELLADGDVVVRREAAAGLGRVEIAGAFLAERVDALSAVAEGDADVSVRLAATTAMGGIDDARAAAALARLVERGDESALVAARALADSGSGSREVARLLQRVFDARGDGADVGVQEALLGGFGRALARGACDPGVGARLLASLALSVDEGVARAASDALDDALVEWDRLDRSREAAFFLSRLSAAGWPPDALDQAVAQRALAEDGEPLLALAAGERIERRHRGTVGPEAARLVSTGLVLQSAALLVLERGGEARERLERAERVLVGALAARPELTTRPLRLEAGAAEAAVDLWQRLCAVRAFAIFERVSSGANPFDDEVLGLARAAHLAALEAQLVGMLGDSDVYTSNLEAVLGRSLAPRALLAPNARGDDALAWLERHARTYAALAAVAPTELPGFLGVIASAEDRVRLDGLRAQRSPLVDALADEQRLTALQSMRIADLERISRRANDPAEIENRGLWQRVQEDLLEKIGTDEQNGFAPLLEYRTIATTALAHATDLRAVGASERALEHALCARDESQASPLAPTGSRGAWFGARLALAVGTAATDVGDGDQAARELEAAHERLVALENDLSAELAAFDAGRSGPLVLESTDPLERRRLERELEDTRDLRAQVLVSLAVNANVRLRDVAGARAYFERALALRQDDFMRVLSACYAARAGRIEEARFTLSSVTPAPELDYNLACTHALLGDVEEALVHLERALEALETRGARQRQVGWAREDPDFESLRADPRFEELLARFAG
jgi:tetratricopeptide (TPR) repeat protein